MSKLQELEKLLAHLENGADRTDKSPFRRLCQSSPLDIQKDFSSGASRAESAGVAITGRGAREREEQRKLHAHLENPTDQTDINGAATSDPTRCAHCGQGEHSGAMIVPFGTASAGHVWLHSGCWREWYTKGGARRCLSTRMRNDGARAPWQPRAEWLAGGGQVPADIDEAVHLARCRSAARRR